MIKIFNFAFSTIISIGPLSGYSELLDVYIEGNDINVIVEMGTGISNKSIRLIIINRYQTPPVGYKYWGRIEYITGTVPVVDSTKYVGSPLNVDISRFSNLVFFKESYEELNDTSISTQNVLF